MKKYNKLPLIVGALAGVSLLTAGFAGWIITGATATEQTGFVDITVAEVVDNRIKATMTETDAVLQFDATNPTNPDSQLKPSQDANEDMDIGGTVKVEFNNNQGDEKIGTILKGFTFTVEFTDSTNNALKKAINDDKFVESPFANLGTEDSVTFDVEGIDDYTTSKNLGSTKWESPSTDYLKTSYDYSVAGDGKSATLVFKFGFRWGEAFGNVNPVNTTIDETTTIDKIVGDLTKLKDNLNNNKNLLNITVTPKIK